jgi:hypothetical protein
MTWIVDIPEEHVRHRCDPPPKIQLQSRKVGSVWECDRCYRKYELQICSGYLGKLQKGLVAI